MFSYFIPEVKSKFYWFGVFYDAMVELSSAVDVETENIDNLDITYDYIFIQEVGSNRMIAVHDAIRKRAARGEKLIFVHNDNVLSTQNGPLDQSILPEVIEFQRWLYQSAFKVIAFNSCSFKEQLSTVKLDRRHLLHMPPTLREFGDEEGRGWFIYGRLRNKYEATLAGIAALLSWCTGTPLTIGSLSANSGYQTLLHRWIKSTSRFHRVTSHHGGIANLTGKEEAAAWNGCSTVIIPRKQGHTNSAVLTKALAEGKLVIMSAIDATKYDFKSPDIVVVNNTLGWIWALIRYNKHLKHRRAQWRYQMAEPFNYQETFEEFKSDLKAILTEASPTNRFID